MQPKIKCKPNCKLKANIENVPYGNRYNFYAFYSPLVYSICQDHVFPNNKTAVKIVVGTVGQRTDHCLNLNRTRFTQSFAPSAVLNSCVKIETQRITRLTITNAMNTSSTLPRSYSDRMCCKGQAASTSKLFYEALPIFPDDLAEAIIENDHDISPSYSFTRKDQANVLWLLYIL
jgi:hypothetical protein